MFRPIRRKNKEISADACRRLLQNERRAVLAVNGEDGYPYAVPINYLYSETDNAIYFHGSLAGYKADMIRNNEKVCLTVFGNEQIKEEAWAPFLSSVVIFGRCRMISDRDAVTAKVREFAKKYYPNDELIDEEIKVFGKAVQMFKIEIEHMSGKEIQEK